MFARIILKTDEIQGGSARCPQALLAARRRSLRELCLTPGAVWTGQAHAGGHLRRFLPAARAHSAQSGPAMVNFNGAPYSHLHSLQGDVAGIVDYAENLVVEYKYNPWGKPILL